MGHMPCRDMIGGMLTMSLLVIKENIGAVGL
jgi:hypothetical protein